MPVLLLDPLKFYAFIAASPHTLLCFISESGNADESVLKLFKSYPPEKFRDLPFAMLDVADHVGLQNSHPARRMNVCATPAFVLFQRGQELARFVGIPTTHQIQMWLGWMTEKTSPPPQATHQKKKTSKPQGGPFSVRHIIENLECFHCQKAELVGIMNVEPEYTCLLPEQADQVPGSIWASGLWVDFYDQEKLNPPDLRFWHGRRVQVFGVVRKGMVGHLGPWLGAVNVMKIRMLDAAT